MKPKSTPDRGKLAPLLGDTPPELLELGAGLRPSKALVLKILNRWEARANDLLKELAPPGGTDNGEARARLTGGYVRRARPGDAKQRDEQRVLLQHLLSHVSLCRDALIDGREPWKPAYHMYEICAVAQMALDADPVYQHVLWAGGRVMGAGPKGDDPLVTARRHAQYRAEYEQHRRAGLGKMAARRAVAKKHGVTPRTLQRVGCDT